MEKNLDLYRLFYGESPQDKYLAKILIMDEINTQHEDFTKLQEWLGQRPHFANFVKSNSFLIRLLMSNSILKTNRDIASIEDLRGEQGKDLDNYFDRVIETNPHLANYLADKLHLARFLMRNPFFLTLLDENPHLTDMLSDDATFIKTIPNDFELTWNETPSWKQSLQPIIGIVDNPRRAQQHLLKLDLPQNHVVIFGAGGSGKTTALRSIMLSLAATYHPRHLHLYVLDYAGGKLKDFEGLPHVGTYISPERSDERERLERLLRFLNNKIFERSELLGGTSLIAYNTINHANPLPAIVILIDNFGDIRSSYEDMLPTFISLMREGRALGIHFIVTANTPNEVSAKVYGQINTRLTLYMSDSSEYVGIVGRGGVSLGEIPGRGLIKVERNISNEPLEFQIALPIFLTDGELKAASERRTGSEEEFVNNNLVEDLLGQLLITRIETSLISPMKEAIKRETDTGKLNKDDLPQEMKILPTQVSYERLLKEEAFDKAIFKKEIVALLGMNDLDLKPFTLALRKQHYQIIGPPLSGRTNFLRTWILSLAQNYSPDELGFVLIDPRQTLESYGGSFTLRELPHVLDVIYRESEISKFLHKIEIEFSDKDEIRKFRPTTDDAAKKLAEEIKNAKNLSANDNATETNQAEAQPEAFPLYKKRKIFVFIDNFETLDDILPKSNAAEYFDEPLRRIADSTDATDSLYFIIAGDIELTKRNSGLQRKVASSRLGFALGNNKALEKFVSRIPRGFRDVDLGEGRGFHIQASKPSLVQIANFEPDNTQSKAQQAIISSDQIELYEEISLNGHGDGSLDSNERDSYATVVNNVIQQSKLDATGKTINKIQWHFDRIPESFITDEIRYIPPEERQASKTATSTRSQNTNRGPAPEPENEYEINKKKNSESQAKEILSARNLPKLSVKIFQDIGLTIVKESFDKLLKSSEKAIQTWLDNGVIGLPQSLSPEQSNLVENHLKLYEELSPEKIALLNRSLLETIGLVINDKELNKDKLLEFSPQDFEKKIKDGSVQFPEIITANIQTIEAYLTIRQTLTGANLGIIATKPNLLNAFVEEGLKLGVYQSQNIAKLDDNELELAIKKEKISLPAQISPDLLNRTKAYKSAYDFLPSRLFLMPLPLLQALEVEGLQFNANLEEIFVMNADLIMEKIILGELQLPESLSPELKERITRYSKIVKALEPEKLRQLPQDLLEELEIDIDLKTADNETIVQARQAGTLFNLKILSPDMVKRLQNLAKAKG